MPSTSSAPLWTPSIDRINASNMKQFMDLVNERFDLSLSNYEELHAWSIRHSANFWALIADYSDIKFQTPATATLEQASQFPGIADANGVLPACSEWFANSELNFAENLLSRKDSQTALIACGEPNLNGGVDREISYQELYLQVAKLAASLKSFGLKKGDRVAAFMPNTLETIVAMLATTSLGGIWSSCSPDFGIQGVKDRFGQIAPKILFTTDGYFYGGKTLDSLQKVKDIQQQIDSIEHTIVIPHIHLESQESIDLTLLNDAGSSTAVHWNSRLSNDTQEIDFVPVSFDHPLYIMYSSGTTGVPKCIVHSVGGTLLQHAKELRLHTDLKADDRIFYYTTCGWMMWNWLVSSLSVGATTVLYDGSPFYPSGHCLWEMAEKHKISIFGTSAKYLAALEKADIKPGKQYDLAALKGLLSTGSPLSHESFDYVYRDIKQDLCLSSISGGTDIISCFALGNPILPVFRGELQCAGLGMAVDIFDPNGQSLRLQKGELVCTQPFPSCPIGFWADPLNEKFHKAYFANFDNIWAHGDYGEITENGGIVIHGRSDAVLNPGGVRIGTAEIYRQVEKLEQVTESIAIGQQWLDDVRIVLFVILKDGLTLDTELQQSIRTTIRSNTTPRHVPAKIIQVSDIPRTISGKIVELAVRNVVHGDPVKNTDALKNPEALTLFKDLAELKD